MANFFAYSAFDQTNLDLNRLVTGEPDRELLEDENFRAEGLFFPDVYALAWASGTAVHASAFLGKNFSVDSDTEPTGGVLQGYIELKSDGSRYVPQWIVTGLSLSLTETYSAALTDTRADDLQFISKALAGNDKMYLSGQNDRADGMGGNDLVRGGLGNDLLAGGSGNDSLLGQDGNDRLYLDSGRDVLDGGAGTDWVQARGATAVTLNLSLSGAQRTGFDEDRLIGIENAAGAGGDDVLIGSKADNVLSGQGGRDRLLGGDGADQLTGHAGSDSLSGGQGRDALKGGGGRDVLIGDAGTDILIGGADGDRFVFNNLSDTSVRMLSADLIRDFDPAADVIDLRKIDASQELRGNNKFAFSASGNIGAADGGEVTFRHQDRAGTANDLTIILIDTDGDTAIEGRIRLAGIHDLGADDFLL